jgi:anti-anti-sigma factor
MNPTPLVGRPSTYNGTLDDLVHYSREQILDYYRMTADHLPLYIVLFEIEGDTYRTIFANAPTRMMDGFNKTFMYTIDESYNEHDKVNMRDMFETAIQTRKPVIREIQMTTEREAVQFWITSTIIPIPDQSGQIKYLMSYSQDITERKLYEQEQARLFNELSTPLLSISDTIVVMPLIGTIDSQRVQHMITTLLNGVAELHAKNVILDITGVPVVDTQVANALIQAAQSVRLLGAQIILCGIRPEVAQVLVNLGVDFSQLSTHATLQSAITATI